MSSVTPKNDTPTSSWLRQIVEAVIFLSCAVVLFRTFAAEGYMISTGSMAPSLLGYHRQITCTACQYSFAHGASAGVSTSVTASAQAEVLGQLSEATCPNCGHGTVDTGRFPRNEGDQLLVHKRAYDLRTPRRWETIVFRNPSNPVEAYVKRVGGLPGETITIERGDVYVDGVLQRKPLLTQRSMRVPVYDDAYRPTDGRWVARWSIDEGVLEQDGRYDFVSPSADDLDGQRGIPTSTNTNWQWVTYRHWLRAGGVHRTSVDIPAWPRDATTIAPDWPQLRYDADAGQLVAHGVLDASWHQRLRTSSRDESFVAAVDRLETKSHVSPIVDHYGYNRDQEGRSSYAVRDLMWSGRVFANGGLFRVQMLYGRQPFYTTFDLTAGTVSVATLGPGGREDLLATAPIAAQLLSMFQSETGVLVEMSLFDRQVLVAVGDQSVLPAISFAPTELAEERSRRPVRFGVRELSAGDVVSVADVRLYRDVYVTPKGHTDEPFVVAEDTYFVLGDNSPVSVDSRVWDKPTVGHAALIGKPFLVHLPSRQQEVSWDGAPRHVRLPDFERVRYIR